MESALCVSEQSEGSDIMPVQFFLNRYACDPQSYLRNDALFFHKGCSEGDVRLVEGSTRLEGRVEICKRNAWGTVCHNSWSGFDARVVCRQLGYSAVGMK